MITKIFQSKYEVESIILKFCEQLKQTISKEIRLKIHIKSYKAKLYQKRRKYSINAQLLLTKGAIILGRIHGWDLKTSLHKAIVYVRSSLIIGLQKDTG